MVTLEQFLVVALIVLLTVIVACGVAAVVLLKKALDARRTEKTQDEQQSVPTRDLRQRSKGPRADQSEWSKALPPRTLPKQAGTALGDVVAGQPMFLHDRVEAIYRIYDKRHLEGHERYAQMHMEMLAALRDLNIDVSGVEIHELHDEKTPTITVSDSALLTKKFATYARFLADRNSVGRQAGKGGLTREGGGPVYDGAPA